MATRASLGQPARLTGTRAARQRRVTTLGLALAGSLVIVTAGCASGDSGSEQAGNSPVTVTPTPTATSTSTATATAVPPTAKRDVTRDEARQIALRAAGGGRVEKIEADDEDGRRVWKVEIRKSAREKHKVEIDVATGDVVKHERDTDD